MTVCCRQSNSESLAIQHFTYVPVQAIRKKSFYPPFIIFGGGLEVQEERLFLRKRQVGWMSLYYYYASWKGAFLKADVGCTTAPRSKKLRSTHHSQQEFLCSAFTYVLPVVTR